MHNGNDTIAECGGVLKMFSKQADPLAVRLGPIRVGSLVGEEGGQKEPVSDGCCGGVGSRVNREAHCLPDGKVV